MAMAVNGAVQNGIVEFDTPCGYNGYLWISKVLKIGGVVLVCPIMYPILGKIMLNQNGMGVLFTGKLESSWARDFSWTSTRIAPVPP